jgi:hypothetical protein
MGYDGTTVKGRGMIRGRMWKQGGVILPAVASSKPFLNSGGSNE